MATRRSLRREAVIDASVSAAWVFDDESDPGADAVLDEIRSGEVIGVVPQHWKAEIANAIMYGEIRGRISWEAIPSRLAGLNRLQITTDTALNILATLDLARRHGLTVYDALYLELAIRRNAPLATLDDKLRRAASEAGVTALTSRQ